jgi:hypothetical protein
MASYDNALVREYVLSCLEHLSNEVAFTTPAFTDMRRDELDLSDVVSVLEASSTATIAKENPDDAFFSLVGTTCDDVAIRVIVSIETNTRGVCVHHVNRQ